MPWLSEDSQLAVQSRDKRKKGRGKRGRLRNNASSQLTQTKVKQ